MVRAPRRAEAARSLARRLLGESFPGEPARLEAVDDVGRGYGEAAVAVAADAVGVAAEDRDVVGLAGMGGAGIILHDDVLIGERGHEGGGAVNLAVAVVLHEDDD